MMRKYLIGALIGFLLTLPFTTGAESKSMIGKKITKEYDVIVDGKKIPVKAISINGTSYTPNRALANAVGYDIAFTGDTVIMSDPSLEGAVMESPSPTQTEQGGDPVEQELETIKARIVEINKFETEYMGKITVLMSEYNVKPENRVEIQKEIDNLNGEMEKLVTERDELIKRKAELEAQATPTP